MSEQQQQQAVLSTTSMGRDDGLEKRASVSLQSSMQSNIADLESGGGGGRGGLMVEEKEGLLSGMIPPTPSKDKQLRVQPWSDAMRGALLRLPKRQRTIIVVYVAVIHLLLVLLVFFK